METKTFDEQSRALQDVLQKANMPQDLIRSLIDTQRGPLSTLEANAAAYEYYMARPGDPGGNLTLDDVSRLMQNAVDDWRVSLKALEDVTALTTQADRLPSAIAIGQHLDWQGLRTAYGNTVNLKEKPAVLVRDSFRDFGQLAKDGALADALKKTGARFAEGAEGNAAAFEAHAKKGYDSGRSYEVIGYGSRAAGWGLGSVVSAVGAWGLYSSSSYGAATAAGYLVAGGAAVCTGAAIACAGLAAYGVYRACRRMRWDDDWSPTNW